MSKVIFDYDSTTMLLSVSEGNASSSDIDPDMYPLPFFIMGGYLSEMN